MTSEKSYACEQRLDNLRPGPLTAFSPLLPVASGGGGWSVLTPYSGAWVQWLPYGNLVRVDAFMSCGITTDGTKIGAIPPSDAAGNNLWPPQQVPIPAATDDQRIGAGHVNAASARLHLTANGNLFCYGFAATASQCEVAAFYRLDPM